MEKEFYLKIVNGKIHISNELEAFLKEFGTGTLKVKINSELHDIIKNEKISRNLVYKIASKQRIPLEIALDVVRSKGKLAK